jgi:N-acetylglucosamine malate deacetylase 1
VNNRAVEVDVLAIGAHMGDEVAWGMALAAHARQGLKVGMLHLTPGEKGHRTMAPEDYAAQKREEAARCAEILGAQTWELPYRDGELPVADEVKHAVARVLREARPRVVVTHWSGSIHKDHTAAAENLPDARYYAGLPAFKGVRPPHWVPHVYFGENWEDQAGYAPEVYLEILPEDLERWEAAMSSYALFRGEVAKFPYLDYYRSLARVRGCEGGFEYANTFALPPDARRRRTKTLMGEAV